MLHIHLSLLLLVTFLLFLFVILLSPLTPSYFTHSPFFSVFTLFSLFLKKQK
jgi:hypothetical protein